LSKFQSQAAIETARKDFGQVVTQAQRELTKLTADVHPAAQPEPSTETPAEQIDTASAGQSSESDTTPVSSSPTSESTPMAQTLFSRLQSALPPNVVSTVQNNIPDSLKHASENIDLAQLRTTLSSEFQRVQGVTRAQAEDYMHKSEVMLRDVMKEASEVLRDAVKVIPPEQGAGSGLIWDGTDMWMLPSDPSETRTQASGKGKQSVQRAVATRAEALLKRLKHDPEILAHDPEADAGVRELYTQWINAEVETQEKGIDGELWTARRRLVLDEPSDGPAMQSTLATLGESVADLNIAS
jgi:hypothetical protein